MKHKILWLIVVILLGLFVFAKANQTNPTVMKINSFLWRKQELILTWVTDTGETLATDLTWIQENTWIEVATSPEETSDTQNQTPVMCTMDYTPVCAAVQVECVRAPCPPINQTFGNRCQMDANKLAKFLYTWECMK